MDKQLPHAGDTVEATIQKNGNSYFVQATFVTYSESGNPVVVLREAAGDLKPGDTVEATSVEVKDVMSSSRSRRVKGSDRVYIPAHYRGWPDWSRTIRRKSRPKQAGISRLG